MGLVHRFFSKPRREVVRDGASRLADATREQTRKELIAMAVRDTLKKFGVSQTCVTAEGIQGTLAGREKGMHLQLVFREWQPNLLGYVVALQTLVRARLLRLDPLSATWLTGVSWRFDPINEQQWPRLLPPRSSTPAPAQKAAAAHPRPSLDVLFAARDAVFGDRSARNEDFSPTMPMR